ncbi:MAG: type II toxin-antitoxin system Phd/YefM family antitoxin [Chlorobiaceae bacterium]
MIAVSTTELRRNLRKYLDMANKERVIVQCGKSETYEIVPTGTMSDTDQNFLNPKVNERLKSSIEQAQTGKTRVLKKEEIKNFLGLE